MLELNSAVQAFTEEIERTREILSNFDKIYLSLKSYNEKTLLPNENN